MTHRIQHRLRFFQHNPSGPHAAVAAIDHVVLSGAAIGFVGDTAQLTATAYDSHGDVVTGVAVTWSSSQPTWISVVAGLCTFLSPGTATITATVDGRAYTTTATAAAQLSLTLDWAPLVRRADLDQPLTFLAESPSNGNGTQTTRPHMLGHNWGISTARVTFPKSVDEWGIIGNQSSGGYMKTGNPPSTDWGSFLELGNNSGPYDNTVAYRVTPQVGSESCLNARFDIDWKVLSPTIDDQDASTYKRSAAIAIKADSLADVGKLMRLNYCAGDTLPTGQCWWQSGNPPPGVTIYGHQDVTLTADWQYVGFTFPDSSFVGHDPHVVLTTVSGTDTGGVSDVAVFGHVAFQIEDGADSSNWLRPAPFHSQFGLHTNWGTKNSWAPDCDQPTLLAGASRVSTAVTAPDNNRYYGGRTLSQYTLPANGDGITTPSAVLVDSFDGVSYLGGNPPTDVISNIPVSAIWLHWYIEPGVGALPADGALQGYVTSGPSVVATFTGADSSTSPGNADTGQTPIQVQGTWGRSGNAAYIATDGGSGNALVYDCGSPNGTVKVTYAVIDGGMWVIGRVADINNMVLVFPTAGNTVLQLFDIIGGGATQLGSDAPHTLVNGDIIELVLNGNQASVKVNGVQVIAPQTTSITTGNHHGIGAGGSNAGISRWDDFSFTGTTASYGPVNLVRDPAQLRRANGGAFYRARIPVNLASEGYLNFTPKIVNASGAQLQFNAYRAAVTSEGSRTAGRHGCLVPARTITRYALNNGTFSQIDQFVRIVSRREGVWIARMLLPYAISDLTNLNGAGPTDCGMWQTGPYGSADASFESNFTGIDATHVTFQAFTERGSPSNPGSWQQWNVTISNIDATSLVLPAFTAFDIALAWKAGAVVAIGIGEGTGTGITWLNNGDHWHGGTVSITADTTSPDWELDVVNGESHGGIQADRDVTREGSGWIQALAASKTVDPLTVKDSVALYIAQRLGPRVAY